MHLTDKHRAHWRKNTVLTASLVAIWFVATFVVSFYARDLSFNFLGWPFGFWMTAQGALIIYVAITWFYARRMRQLDEEHGVAEGDE